MAITVPKAVATATSAEPGTASFGSLPSAGNAVIVLYTNNGDTNINTVSDNQSNTYTRVVNEQDSTAANTFAGAFWCPQIGTPGGTFTVSCSSTNAVGNTWGLLILEVAGLTGASVDQTGVANDGGLSPTSLTITGSAQNNNATALAIYAMVLKGAAGNSGFFSAGATSGWTNTLIFNATNQGIGAAAGYKILSALETTQAVSQTWTTGTACAGIVATFSSTLPPYGRGVFVTA